MSQAPFYNVARKGTYVSNDQQTLAAREPRPGGRTRRLRPALAGGVRARAATAPGSGSGLGLAGRRLRLDRRPPRVGPRHLHLGHGTLGDRAAPLRAVDARLLEPGPLRLVLDGRALELIIA